MRLNNVLSVSVIIILFSPIAVSCERSSGTGAAGTVAGVGQMDSTERLKKINIATTNIANSFRSMQGAEQRFLASRAKPRQADLELFWMALQSTTRNMERIDKMIAEDPSVTNDARNLWNGRVQEGLAQVEESGLLAKLNGPITSRLGAAFGAERVENDINRLLTAAHSIQVQLGVPTSTPE